MSIITNTSSLCLYSNYKATTGEAITYSQLLEKVRTPKLHQLTDHTQVKVKKSTLPLITPFISADLTKTQEAAQNARYGALVIDFDKQESNTLADMANILRGNYQLGEFCGFTTSSHTIDGLNAFKFVIPLAEACDVHQYTALAEGVALLFGADTAQARKTQGFYAPCDMISPSVYDHYINNGELLSPSSELWRDAIERYLNHIDQIAQEAPVKRRTHVGGDSGIFDLINKHYTLESLLSAARHTQKGNKWLSPHSQSGIAGGVIFDTTNGKRFYSHSSSCPLGKDAHDGHSLDVADVLAVTRYGGDYAEMVKQEALIVDMEGQKQRQLAHQQAQANNRTEPSSAAWSEPIPLKQAFESKPLAYPLDSLPDILKQAVEAIAEHVQVPIAMAAQCVIGAITHIAQANVNAYDPNNDKGMPCSLFLLTEGQSGSRKSTAKKLADRAIAHKDSINYMRYEKELKSWKLKKAGIPKAEREKFELEEPEPKDPTTIFSDATIEPLIGAFMGGATKNASISSDEAGQFFGGYTMKSDTRANALGSFTKLFDDGSTHRTRSKSNETGSGRVSDCRLAFNLQGQREILVDALKDPILRGQGFLPRFILAVPENLAGTRIRASVLGTGEKATTDPRLKAYWARCKGLLDDCPRQRDSNGTPYTERQVIQLSAQAKKIELAYSNQWEGDQLQGRQYAKMQPFASRASELARRLATVLAHFNDEEEIVGETMQGACDIVEHSLTEWLRYNEIELREESDAEKLLNWLLKQKEERILKSVLTQKVTPKHLRKAQIRDDALRYLLESGHVRIEEIQKKEYVALNPSLLKRG